MGGDRSVGEVGGEGGGFRVQALKLSLNHAACCLSC